MKVLDYTGYTSAIKTERSKSGYNDFLSDNPITLLGTGALGALFWGTWGTRLGHLGHSSGALGALGALVWGTWGTRLGHLRKFFEVLEVPTMQLRHLFAITHLLGKAEALQ